MKIFVVDFETHIWSSGAEDGPDRRNRQRGTPVETNNGIIVYFITDKGRRQQAFLKYEPYFYLKLAADIDYRTEEGKRRVQNVQKAVFSIGRTERTDHVKKAEPLYLADSDDLLFPVDKLFLKVTVESPKSVPEIRDAMEQIRDVVEWREADIQFHHRVAIDKKINISKWYKAEINRGYVMDLQLLENRMDIPELKLTAYDIEVNSPRTRDPSIEKDQITMISLYSGNRDFVMVNSEVVRSGELEDVMVLIRDKDGEHHLPWVDWQYARDFKTNPKPNKFSTLVKVTKFANEQALLQAFIRYLNEEKPDVITDFYGDRFDLPFIAGRAKQYGMDFEQITGIKFKWKRGKKDSRDYMKDVDTTEIAGPFHLDAFLWNDKYSYLPKKDLGLKPSVQRRLKLIPIGRESLWIMDQDPAETVAYAASDGYITWRYVKEIILDFCISMGRMFPVPSCELLTKRAGSLDDLLVDAIGQDRRIVAKKRFSQEGVGRLSENIIISSIAYTGGAVDAPNPGIWRRDLDREVTINQEKMSSIIQVLPSIYQSSMDRFLRKTAKISFERLIKQYFISEENYLDYLKKSGPDDYFSLGLGYIARENPSEYETIREEIEELDRKLKQLEVKGDSLEELLKRLKSLKTGNYRLKGIHCDVTSMYPSQIRQYKIQPSGIVSADICRTCGHKEPGMVCAFDQDWTLKINAVKPCYHKNGDGLCTGYGGNECPYNSNEDTCANYDPGDWKDEKNQEFYCYQDGKVSCFTITDELIPEPVSTGKTYLEAGFPPGTDLYEAMVKFIREAVKGAEISTNLPRADITKSGNSYTLIPPENTFLFLEVKQKNLSMLVSVKSRVCQKAYDFIADIMDQFFLTRVFHKSETQRLKTFISAKKSLGEPVPQELETRRLYHDSTQLGLKVPLNSIYGLLGMKAGVHNASMPCAGITTALSATLIHWAVDFLSDLGYVTEYDTDGVWVFIPESFPDEFTLRIEEPDLGINERRKVPLLAELLNREIREQKNNPHYWKNDGKTIELQPKNLLEFEQDGPYDFQMVMGKKKYIVFDWLGGDKWDEKEITGLESKRADFSLMHKELQETIIKAYQSDYGRTTVANLFHNALESASGFIRSIKEGRLAEDYFVIPRAITQPLEEYKTILPQVEGALILRELGYSIEPGMKIDLLMIKSAGKKKSQSVIPRQLFDFPFDEIKKILIKRGIATLGFTFGTIKTKEDIKREIIDTDAYISDLIGGDRLIDRMIVQLARAMNVELKNVPKNLKIKGEVNNGTTLLKTVVNSRKHPPSKIKLTESVESSVHSSDPLGESTTSVKSVLDQELVGTVPEHVPVKQEPKTIFDFLSTGTGNPPKGKTSGQKSSKKSSRKGTGKSGQLRAAAMGETKVLVKAGTSKSVPWQQDIQKTTSVIINGYPEELALISAAIAAQQDPTQALDFKMELFHCPECDLTWDITESHGDKCPICSTTLVYLY